MPGYFNRPAFRFRKSGALLSIAAAFACCAPVLRAQLVYSKAQADRGQQLYQSRCVGCHGAAMNGGGAPPLTGNVFTAAWGGQSAWTLVSKIKNTMPPDNAGKLTPQQAADLVALILQKGNFPAGSADLVPDEKALSKVVLPGKPAVASAAGAVPAFTPTGNMAQLMRGILFPSSNMIFNVQTTDPGVPVPAGVVGAGATQSFSWVDWGAGIYKGWDIVDYAAIAVADSAPLLLTPRRCENGRPAPVDKPDWIRFTQEMAEAGRVAYRASQTRNQEAVSDATSQLSDSCLHCHEVYRDKRRSDPSDKSGRCLP
jgi:mono/diheme cytochrome c family protein